MKSIIAASLLAVCISSIAIAAPKKTPEKPWTKEPSSFLGVNFNGGVVGDVPRCEKAWSHQEVSLCYTDPILDTFFMQGLPDLGISGYELAIKVEDKKVKYFNLDAKSSAYPALASLFIDKYGAPTSRKVEKVKTKAGAEFENETMVWKGKAVTIVLEKFGKNINTSTAFLSSNDLMEKSAKSAEAASKAAASKL